MRIPGTRTTWPVNFSLSRHWLWNGERGGGCQHGPISQNWPWWKLIAARLVVPRFGEGSPCIGRFLWVYYRRGAFCLEVVVDRRDLGLRREPLDYRLRAWLARVIAPPVVRPGVR